MNTATSAIINNSIFIPFVQSVLHYFTGSFKIAHSSKVTGCSGFTKTFSDDE